jgi:hypothetical protein
MYTNLHFSFQALSSSYANSLQEFVFILNLRGRISNGIAGPIFVTEGRQGFAGHRIREGTFASNCFKDRGSGDSLVVSARSSLRWPISVRTESRVGSMSRLVFTKL